MDSDRPAGAGKKITGKIKETVGKMVGNEKLETEGKADQMKGGVQETYGDAKDSVRDTLKK